MNPPQVYMCSPSWTLLPPPSPYYPSGAAQCTSPKHPVLCIEPGLATRFIHDILHVSLLNLLQYCFCFTFWVFFGHKAGELLAPQPRIEPTTPCVGRRSPNHWTAREVLPPLIWCSFWVSSSSADPSVSPGFGFSLIIFCCAHSLGLCCSFSESPSTLICTLLISRLSPWNRAPERHPDWLSDCLSHISFWICLFNGFEIYDAFLLFFCLLNFWA